MNIEHYISQLLYRYQCVTVPGFGAFLTETNSAFLQESNQTFFPPSKTVFFNSYLKNNDGLLANHVASQEKTTYDLAVEKIGNQVENWKKLLKNNDVIILKNIGELKANGENILFTSLKNTNYLSDSFGLNSFVSPTIKREVLKELKIDKEEIKVLPLQNLKNTRSNYLKYAAVFLVSLGAVGFSYKTFLTNAEQSENLRVQAQVQKEVETKIQEATFSISNPYTVETISLKNKSTTLPYHIVAGAFREKNNAEKACKELSENGFNSRVLEKNAHDLYPVVFSSYAEYTQAQYNLTKIQQENNPEAWLLIQDL